MFDFEPVKMDSYRNVSITAIQRVSNRGPKVDDLDHFTATFLY